MDNESQRQNQSEPMTLGDKLGFGLVVSFAFVVFLFLQLHEFEISKWNGEMSALADRSSLHSFIVPSYRSCMISRSPNHIVCVGAISQAAQMKGFDTKDIRIAFSEIEDLNAKYGTNGF